MGHNLGNNYGKFYSMLSKPVLVDCNFIVDNSNGNGLGVRSVKGQGVQNVFMHTTVTPGMGPNGLLNPNPAVGFAWVELAYNYTRYYGGASGFVSPTTGGTIAINGSALTIGNPYIVASVGHAAAGTVTIAPVADVAGSLASTWFRLSDAYGNTFIIWFSVSGVGSAPIGVSGRLVQQSILANATAAQIGAALVLTIQNLPSGIAGVSSFTASGTTTVTAVNTNTNPYELPGGPMDGAIATGFTFAFTVNDHNHADWYAVGVPQGTILAPGIGFIAKATGHGSSTGLVVAPGVSGIASMEVIGNPNTTIAPAPFGGSPNVGGWILVQMLNGSGAPTAPANGSTCSMQFYVEQGTEVGGNNE